MSRLSLSEKIFIPTYNDRTQLHAGEVSFDYEKCNGCTMCAQICPARALVMEDKRPRMKAVEENECMGCADCVAICPEGAITLKNAISYSGYYKTIDQGEIKTPRL